MEKPKQPKPLVLAFEPDERSGEKVFSLEGVTKSISGTAIGPIDLTIQYGDRILITGPNGSGKTTLLSLLLGNIVPDGGVVAKGTRLNVGYLPQEQYLLPDATVRDEFIRLAHIDEGLGRRALNRFKIEAVDVEKKIHELSSGERSRLTLAILMANKVNCLVLDEPTNHLDLEVLQSLETALVEFPGTLVVVSHDRYFIDRIAPTRILRLENGQLKVVG